MNNSTSGADSQNNNNRTPSCCARCWNHGEKVYVKGHKTKCPLALCDCWKCRLISRRKKVLEKERTLTKKVERRAPYPTRANRSTRVTTDAWPQYPSSSKSIAVVELGPPLVSVPKTTESLGPPRRTAMTQMNDFRLTNVSFPFLRAAFDKTEVSIISEKKSSMREAHHADVLELFAERIKNNFSDDEFRKCAQKLMLKLTHFNLNETSNKIRDACVIVRGSGLLPRRASVRDRDSLSTSPLETTVPPIAPQIERPLIPTPQILRPVRPIPQLARPPRPILPYHQLPSEWTSTISRPYPSLRYPTEADYRTEINCNGKIYGHAEPRFSGYYSHDSFSPFNENYFQKFPSHLYRGGII